MSKNELTLNIDLQNIDTIISEPQLLIKHLNDNNISKLQEYVLDNLNSLDGGPSISNFEIKNFKFNSVIRDGSFRLKFQIDRQYCCADTESCSDDYLDFNFQFDNSKMILKSEYFDWTLNN